MSNTYLKILQTEYFEEFDRIRKNRMVTSFHKYGPVKENYGNKLINAVNVLKERLELYEKTGNTDYLADVANMSMIEWKFPQHPNAHFDGREEGPGLGGMTFRDIKRL